MIGVPADWLQWADTPHEPTWRVEFVAAGGDVQPLPVENVELRRLSGTWPRTTASIEWPADPVPGLAPPPLRPYGSQVRISWAPGPKEAPQLLATLWVTRVSLSRPGGNWVAECVDSSGMMDEDNIVGTAPPFGWQPPGGTLLAAVTSLVRRTFPAMGIAVDPAAAAAMNGPVPATFEADARQSPWDVVEALTDLAGVDAHLLPDDSLLLRPVPDVGVPVDHVGVLSNITAYDVAWNTAYNTVLLEFKQNTTVVLGVWQDTRPGSPTSVAALGRRVTLWESREGAPTKAQADLAAKVRGERAAGLSRTLSVDVVGRPWLEYGDTVAVSFLGGPVDEPMLVTFAEHDSRGRSRIGLRNNRYPSGEQV